MIPFVSLHLLFATCYLHHGMFCLPMTIKGDNVVNIWKTQWRHFVFSVLIKVATSMHNSRLYRGAGISHLLASVLEQALDMQCWYNQLHCHKFPYISLEHCRQLGLSSRKDKFITRVFYGALWLEGTTLFHGEKGIHIKLVITMVSWECALCLLSSYFGDFPTFIGVAQRF